MNPPEKQPENVGESFIEPTLTALRKLVEAMPPEHRLEVARGIGKLYLEMMNGPKELMPGCFECFLTLTDIDRRALIQFRDRYGTNAHEDLGKVAGGLLRITLANIETLGKCTTSFSKYAYPSLICSKKLCDAMRESIVRGSPLTVEEVERRFGPISWDW